MKKQFKAESKRLLDLMINSIYTNKDIFLREVISNASDAIDKAYYMSLTNNNIKINKEDLAIQISIDKDSRTITISDNGIGMNKDELEQNLGTIAKSGSNLFKQNNDIEDINIIGQFGVGFYSIFMVADEVSVYSKPYNSDEAYVWKSSGVEGYTIESTTKETFGTDIVIKIKDDDEDYEYSSYLEEYKIKELITKYSNYIAYPIKMEVTNKKLKDGSKDEYEEVKEIETINSMVPIWRKDKKEITEEEYDNFYFTEFYDYQKPLKTINYHAEGTTSFNSILFIPSHASMELYSKDFERGLQLYSNGVLIMEKCKDLLPEYYGFVKGLVDSADVSLNISREILQQDKQLKLISKNIEKKINKELLDMLNKDRENYELFFKEFGICLKLGIYNTYGMMKNELQDLLLFYSSKNKKMVTLKEYVDNKIEDQEYIYYAIGESVDKIDLMPQVEKVKDKYDILYLTEYVDEFVMQVLMEYDKLKFINVANADINLDSEEDKKELDKLNNDNKKLFEKMKEILSDKVSSIKFTNSLKNHPVCLITEGNISTGMEKVLNAMPNDEKIKANTILAINSKHPISKKLKDLSKDEELLEKYTKVLYSQARLIEGLSIENPSEISDIICDILSK